MIGALDKGKEEGGSTAAALIVVAVVIIAIIIGIGGFLLWLYAEPTWWEELIGRTRWDKIREFFDNLFG